MLRETDVFEAQGFAFADQGEPKASALVTVEQSAQGAAATIPDAHLLFNSDFIRSGNDLHLNGHNGDRAIVRDYFGTAERVALLSGDGARLSPDLVDALTKSGASHQYAQATAPAPAASDAVGRVVTASADSTIMRNGAPVTVRPGDVVLRADVLQTAGGTMAVTFNDGSTLNLTANTRIVVSEFVYSPNGTGNSQLLDLVQGSLTFISGEVAHTGDMRIGTPVATMGIRGTVGGVTTASDGTVQFYVSQSATGAVIINQQGQIIANVVQDGPMIVVRPVGPLQIIAEEIQKSPAQLAVELQALQQIVNIKSIGDQLLQQFFQQQQPGPNPQSPQNGPHTQIPTDDKIKITLFLDDKGGGNGGVAPVTHAVVETIKSNHDTPPPPITVPVIINLPINDAPVFAADSYNFSVRSHVAPGTVVGTVVASDVDGDSLVYKIVSGNDDGVFSVDSHGNIIAAGLVDHSSSSSRDLVVSVTDPGGLTDVTAVHIGIQPVCSPNSVALTSSQGVTIDVSQDGATNGFQFAGGGNVTTPGTPEDRIALGYSFDGQSYVVNQAPLMNDEHMTPVGTASYSEGGVSYFSSILSAGHGVTLTQTIGLGANANYFTTDIVLYNGSGSTLSNLRFLRNLDPDQDVDTHGNYSTFNDVLQNPVNGASVAAVSALGTISGASVVLVADGSGWRASAPSGLVHSDPYDSSVYANPSDPDGASGDRGITLVYDGGALAAGASLHVSYITTANVATTGANALVGTAGSNTIDGLGGGDLMFGLAGADSFAFKPGYGAASVADFSGHAAQGDVIDLIDFSFASFNDLKAAATFYDIGTGGDHATKIDFGNGDTLTLLHVDPTHLTAADFIFHPLV
ncbi:FecR domain-containing protein [Undibacter mobilis]|uniref:Cadherin domain-containing protein n=1 Tax=Undibacter mobilis TaxID=2292256 RepID=A0A371B7M4_9BRAD|nr:FecR domain-containing protein [Undibacter mobilis]RDV03544.1 hypothetical protein DXH78_02445 [Undibacter mobilis]